MDVLIIEELFFYVEPKGGVYYVTKRGTKVYVWDKTELNYEPDFENKMLTTPTTNFFCIANCD